MQSQFFAIGQEIKERCYRAGFKSAVAVAERLPVSSSTVYDLWRGVPQGEAVLRQLALLLGEPEEHWLIEGFVLKDTPERRQRQAQMANARAAKQQQLELNQEERQRYLQQFSIHLRELRDERQLSRSEMATRLGVHPSQVNKWTSGQRIPSDESMGQLATLLEIPVEQLRAPLGPLPGHNTRARKPRPTPSTDAATLAEGGHARVAPALEAPETAAPETAAPEPLGPEPSAAAPAERVDLHDEQARRLAFGRRLSDFKRSATVPNSYIAQQVGCSDVQVGRWLNGHRLPGVDQITRLARAVRDEPARLAAAAGYTAEELNAAERQKSQLALTLRPIGLSPDHLLAELALPPAAYLRLREQGIVTIADLTRRTKAQLEAIPMLEPYWVPMIEQRLALHNLTLKAPKELPVSLSEPDQPSAALAAATCMLAANGAPEPVLEMLVETVANLATTETAPPNEGAETEEGPLILPEARAEQEDPLAGIAETGFAGEGLRQRLAEAVVNLEPEIRVEPEPEAPGVELTLEVGDPLPPITLGPPETANPLPGSYSLPISETVPVDYPEHPLFQQANRITQLVLIGLGAFPKEHPLTARLWQTAVDMPRQLALAIRAPSGPAMARALARAAEHALSCEYYLRLADDLRLLPPGVVSMGLEQLATLARSLYELETAAIP